MEPRLAGLRTHRPWLLSMVGVLVSPFVVVGYLGVATVLVLPLLALRGLIPGRPSLLTAGA